MWNQKSDLVLLLPFLLVWILLPNTCDSLALPIQNNSSPPGALNTQQWHSLVRDAIKFLQKQNQPQQHDTANYKPKVRYTMDPNYNGGNGNGMMKHRNIRSGFGDMANALQLYQLHELEKEWASKSRPRFGKRAEVTQDNFLPPYAFVETGEDEYDNEDRDRAGGDAKVSGDYGQELGYRLKGGRAVKYPEDYLLPTL